MVCPVSLKETEQTIIHTMVKRNRTGHYTYNGQKKQDRPLYIQWSKETGQTIIHTMVKRNRTNHYTYNGQKKQDRPLYIQWSKETGQAIIQYV
jgi:hypothetical protein